MDDRERNLLTRAIANTDNKLIAKVCARIRVYLEGVKQASSNGSKAGAEEEIELIEWELGEKDTTGDNKDGFDVSVSK